MNIFKAIIKYVETFIKDIYVSFNPNVVRLKTLAEKYNVNFNLHEIEINCPSVVNPLNQTETIKHQWASEKLTNVSKEIDKTDKGHRYFEALNALKAVDFIVNYKVVEGEKIFSELGIFGRVMYVYIASKQDDATAKYLIETIKPWADKGLYMSDNDFIKVEGVSIGHLFDKFIKPSLHHILDANFNNKEGSSSNLNNDFESEGESDDENSEYQNLIKHTTEAIKLPEDVINEINNLNGAFIENIESNETSSIGGVSLAEAC